MVTEYKSYKKVHIKFLSTGFESAVQASQIRTGKVRDRLYPSVYGVGYIGKGEYKAKVNNKNTKSYQVWFDIIRRSYSPKQQEKQPTYKGCTVSKVWHNFQNFAEWFELNYIEGYHIDKDIKAKGQKVYGPDFCSFVTQAENNIEAHAKHYKFLNINGDVVNVYNLAGFCRANDLSRVCMVGVHLGDRKSHKGWRVKHDL